MQPLHVHRFPADSLARGPEARALFARVASGLRELLPIESMSRFLPEGSAGRWASPDAAPDAARCDGLERERKEHTRRLRASGHFGRPAGQLGSGAAIFENDDPGSPYARLFVRGDQPLAQQYLGVLLAIVGEAVRANLSRAWAELLGDGFDGRIRNVNYCPPHGFVPWHTNRYDAEGWRLYLVDVPAGREGASWFAISDGDRVRAIPDRAGWFNLFRISSDRPLWHCVGGESHRLSCGVRLSDAAAGRLLDRAGAAGPVERHEVPCST